MFHQQIKRYMEEVKESLFCFLSPGTFVAAPDWAEKTGNASNLHLTLTLLGRKVQRRGNQSANSFETVYLMPVPLHASVTYIII